jgi:hypothetical protein
MALETLKGVKEIGGFPVVIMDELREKYPEKFNESGAMDYKWFEADIRPHNFVYVRQDVNSIAFTLQKGPIKEVGVNGCQIDTLIEASLMILEELNKAYPCKENERAIHGLGQALYWLEKRKKNRETRGVEGTSQV